MRYTLLTSCAVAAITLGVGLAKAQAPTQNQGAAATQAQGSVQNQTPGQTREQGRAEGQQRQREPTTSPGKQAGDERSRGDSERHDAGERREDRSESRERSNEDRGRRAEQDRFNDERGRRVDQRFNEERGRRGEQERFSQERGRRGDHERFSEERGRRGDEGWREERRYRTDREFDRDGSRRFDERRYGDRREEWRLEDRRSGGTVGRSYDNSRNVHISGRQRARVHSILVQRRVEPVNVDFPLRVGAHVPNYIRSYELPEEVYDYLPGYERYRYFVAGDEVVIVDPDSMEVVAVLEE
jgi:hypothetical protein